jgi:protein-S-isoprenylcysteine O-methyltransferase Ste14
LLSLVALLLSMPLYYKGHTPPQPAAKVTERVGNYETWLRLMRPLVPTLRFTYLIFVFVETVAFLSTFKPLSTTIPVPLQSIHGFCVAHNSNHTLYPHSQLPPLLALGVVLNIIGSSLRILSHRELGSFFRWQVSVQSDHRLVTTGVYSIVRHPSYTGFGLFAIGQPLMFASRHTFFDECLLSASTLTIG